jgi:diguanylate cyclase (GGDEF)-like protein
MNDTISEYVQQVLIQHVGGSETGIAVIDVDDRFLYVNPTFVSMFGLEDYSPIGRRHDEFLTWMFAHRIGNASKGGLTLEEWVARVHTLYRAQTYHSSETDLINGRWLLMAQQMYASGMIVTVCTDITRAKEAEMAFRAAHAELERLAMTDDLTGVSNRRHFLSHLESERQRVLRYKHPVSLAMLDLDHFKQVNDRYGHPAGDTVLKHFAGLLRSHMRCEDVIGRLGGEEFALLMPETTPHNAQIVLERMRHALAQMRLDFIAPGFAYTFSAGIAFFPLTESSACNHWIQVADQALYQAKTGGRNRTVLHATD